MTEKRLSELIAPHFYDVHWDIWRNKHTHYWFKGGRGSTKSSFVSQEIILNMMNPENKYSEAVVMRKVADTLRESVFEEYQTAISRLGADELWRSRVAPMTLEYLPTGQRIHFRGADKPRKLKSTTVKDPFFIKYVHYEEVDEFDNPEDIRSINQSLLRGATGQKVFYSFNPPKSASNWANQFVEQQGVRDDTYVNESTYLTVPREWLGNAFIAEAEATKLLNPTVYAHEYMGEVVGTGAEVFSNVETRAISDEEFANFETINRGLDFGFGADPSAYVESYFDQKHRILYLLDEFVGGGISNSQLADEINKRNPEHHTVVTDRELRTVSELTNLNTGLRLQMAKKGPDSRRHGIKFLQDLTAIVIDPRRTPNAHREFTQFELGADRFGNLRGDYPTTDDHTIDSVRYQLERYSVQGGFKAWK